MRRCFGHITRRNLEADSFARDYHTAAELAAKKDGTMIALKIKTVADHGYADAAANPSKFPARLFSICMGAYGFQEASRKWMASTRTNRRAASPIAARFA